MSMNRGQSLYIQVLVAISLGILVGYFFPAFGAQLKPLGDGFIKLIKMLIAPIIFCTVVLGIGKMGDMNKVGRVGLKALLYFLAMTSLALVIGLFVVNVLQPGHGMNVDPKSLDTKAIANYTKGAKELTAIDFVMHVIPETVVDAFAKGEILQVLLFSCLLGFTLAARGEKSKALLQIIDEFSHGLFGCINYVMRLAPIGAFGAMGFTIGKFGLKTLLSLATLMAGVYATCLLFIFVVLGIVCRMNGFSIWKLIKYIREEFFIVLGTSSSESVLPRMLVKMEQAGAAKSVVGLVIPTGYSFNLDGTCIYLTMAAIFLAQATNTPLTWSDQLTILGVLLLTSKGAAAVTGGGFITLAATLGSVSHIPIESLALLLGVDRFMSEARALTNLIGNAAATVIVAKWEGALDEDKLQRALNGEQIANEDAPSPVTAK